MYTMIRVPVRPTNTFVPLWANETRRSELWCHRSRPDHIFGNTRFADTNKWPSWVCQECWESLSRQQHMRHAPIGELGSLFSSLSRVAAFGCRQQGRGRLIGQMTRAKHRVQETRDGGLSRPEAKGRPVGWEFRPSRILKRSCVNETTSWIDIRHGRSRRLDHNICTTGLANSTRT